MNRKTIERLLSSEAKHEYGEQGDTACAVYALDKDKCPTCGKDIMFTYCPDCTPKTLPEPPPTAPDFDTGDMVASLVDRPKQGITAGMIGKICWAVEAEQGGFTYCVDFGEHRVLKIWTAPGMHVKDYALRKFRKGFAFIRKGETCTVTTKITKTTTTTTTTIGQLGLF